MNIQPDFEELLRLLEEHNIEYLIVGGYAVAFHGFPRFTKDIDVFYNRSTSNIQTLLNALMKFGFSSNELPAELFYEKGNIVTFGLEPVRVDMVNEISGVLFEDAWPHRVRGRWHVEEGR